jgi:hypothetical protein
MAARWGLPKLGKARMEARLTFGHARRHFPIMLNWSQCSAVERIQGKVSGVWLFKGTRVPVQALFENLESGATVENFLEGFPRQSGSAGNVQDQTTWPTGVHRQRALEAWLSSAAIARRDLRRLRR